MNVMFKRGTQADLLKYINGTTQAVEGSFYLTSDTNRLYIGKKVGDVVKAVAVNQGVITVSSLTALQNITAEAGQFYYVSGANSLCVYNGQTWVQINPDTNTYITGRVTNSETGYDFPVIQDVITQQTESGGELDEDGTTFVSKFAAEGTNGVNVTVDTFTDARGVSYPRLIISQDAYTLKSATDQTGSSATITLGDGHSSDKITLKGSDNVSFETTGANDETIIIKSHNTTLNPYATDSEASNSLSFDANGRLTSTVKDSDGNEVTDNVTPIIAYAPDADGTATLTAKFESGTAALSVYSKAQVDEKFRGLNSMVYKGTVGDTGSIAALPTTNVSVGDTYKFVEQMVVGTSEVRIGDVAIARGTEGSDGYISGTISWDIIPSGDDAAQDTTYLMQSLDAGSQLMENDGGNGTSKGGIQIVDKDSANSTATTYLTVTNDSSVATGTKNVINKVVVAHKEQPNIAESGSTGNTTQVDQDAGSDVSVVIPVLSYDKAGHITKVESKTYNLKDTKFEYDLEYLKIASATTTFSTNGELTATAKVEASLLDVFESTRDTAFFNIKSSTITLNANGDDLVMDIEWGTF